MQHGVEAPSMKMDMDYYAESDLNTLIEAEKIKKDSKRLKAVMARKKHLEYALMKDSYPKKDKKMSSMHSY